MICQKILLEFMSSFEAILGIFEDHDFYAVG